MRVVVRGGFPTPCKPGSNSGTPANFRCVTGTDEANAILGEVSKALWIKGSLRDLHTQYWVVRDQVI